MELDTVAELACTVHQYYTDHPWRTGDGKSPLHFAAMTGQMEIFEMMFQRAQDKNPKDSNGWTPLHHAAGNGHLAICQYIIERVQDKNPKTNICGVTPLHCADWNGHLAICQFIIERVKKLKTKKNPCIRIIEEHVTNPQALELWTRSLHR